MYSLLLCGFAGVLLDHAKTQRRKARGHMRSKLLVFLSIIVLATLANAQDIDTVARAARWKEFSRNAFEKVDFSRARLTRAKIAKLKTDENSDDYALLRGVIFGKRGRIFKERSIQDYLEKQAWYKADAKFSNRVLTTGERANLDFIRLVEAEKHYSVEPGDMRIWRNKAIVDDNLRSYSGTELTILVAEIEAIHG